MKIAQIVCAFPPYSGGIGNSASQIARLLQDKHEITTFSPSNLKPWLRYGHGAFLPQLLWKLRGYDYIYLHYPFFGTAEVVWLYKLFALRPKLIIHYHMDVKTSGLASRILSLPSLLTRRLLFSQAEAIVTASLDYVRNSSIKKYYIENEHKFREIPFGIELDKFQPKKINLPAENRAIAFAKKIVHYVNDRFIKKDRHDLLFVGGLDRAHYFKGIDILLRALARLSAENWRLKVIGDGDLRPQYEALATDLGVRDKVEFIGKASDEDLVRSYQNSDIFVLPSINSNEAFGIVLIEALACGLPVIASDLPGVRRVFDNYHEGLLFEPGNPEDLAHKIQFIFKDENMRRNMAAAARRLAERKYGSKLEQERLETLFL